MKTYIFDTINRIKRFSKKLDVKTTLCEKPWIVFNDSGDKEVLIFNSDGTVLITINGLGQIHKWQWVPANESLIIHQADSIVMLHPDYIDNSILALNRDGTQEYAFLMDENNLNNFAAKSLSQLKDYFIGIEQEEEAKEKEKVQAEYEHFMKTKAANMIFESRKAILLSVIGLLIVMSFIVLLALNAPSSYWEAVLVVILIMITLIGLILIIPYLEKKAVRKFIDEHPDDPIIPYLKKQYKIK